MLAETAGREQPLPRELIKWLQSLDLSFNVKNPKRDLSNGFLTAEILSRYHPKELDMTTFENATRLAAKLDNWEQLHKFAKKKGLNITKHHMEPVIHMEPGAAIAFLFHLYNVLTKRTVKLFQPAPDPEQEVPAFMRDTASKRLKDPSIHRVHDNVERTIRAIDTLGIYHEERRYRKAMEAPLLIQEHRKNAMKPLKEADEEEEEPEEEVNIREVGVKAMAGNITQLKGKKDNVESKRHITPAKAALLKAVSQPKTSVGALAAFVQPGVFVKPAADIMRPLVMNILQESEELSKVIGTQKDVVVAFMDHCTSGGFPDAGKASPEKQREIEEVAVRVFETVANRAQLLVDTLVKSPPEFWKVFSTFFPALTDFSESSPIFESAVFLFKRLGDLMREADPQLTQQLITEVGLPAIARELSKSPEKRESLCEIIYCYTQEDTLNHLLALRSLKALVGENLPVYISCLASFVTSDAQLGLLDEHLLDLYIYYALMAMQSAQPRIRSVGLAILATITAFSPQHHGIVALIPHFDVLAHDEWWEVQAQLLLLSANLLSKFAAQEREAYDIHKEEGSVDGEEAMSAEDSKMSLLDIVSRVFVITASQNVLQVGLSALVPLLSDYPMLLPMFVTVLLQQPPVMRQRLLQPKPLEQGAEAAGGVKMTYVMGNLSRMYEEKCLRTLWAGHDIAKTLTMQLEHADLEHLELEHLEVLLATLPENFSDEESEEWFGIFDKVKQYVFKGLTDPNLHVLCAELISKFWLSPVERVSHRSIEASKKALLQTLTLLYGGQPQGPTQEAAVLQFLKGLRSRGGFVELEITSVINSFQDAFPAEYQASQLRSVLDD